jgi:outer membrane protein assembly factor BamB
MHDIERKSSQDDSTVEITNLPREGAGSEAGATPMTRGPKRHRQSLAMRYLVAGGVVLLILAVIFSVVLVRSRPTSQPRSGTAPAQTQPPSQPSATATPASSSAGSSQFVYFTIADGIAYAGAGTSVNALRIDTGSLLWSSRIDEAVGDKPVVANGVVYVNAGNEITGTLYALRQSDGTQLWHYTSDGPEMSTAVVANGVVYLGTQGDKVLALRGSSGTLLWQYSDNGIGLLSPQLVDGVLYVTEYDQKPGGGNVYALRASDGRLFWQYRAGASPNGTTVIDGVAYVTSQDGTLTALSTSDGRQLWQRAIGGGNMGTMWLPIQAADGVLYVATTKMSAPTASTSSPGLLPQVLAIGSLFWGNVQAVPAKQMVPNKEGVSALYAIRATDGSSLWNFTMNNGKNAMVGWLAVGDGVIYASVMDASTPDTSRGHIYALRSTTGSLLWHYDDNKTSPSNVLLANGVIYVSTYSQDSKSMVYALRAGDGSMLWRHGIGQDIYNAPVLNGTTVYVGTGEGSVYALRADNGAVKWHYDAF